jgi:hypothetical protein
VTVSDPAALEAASQKRWVLSQVAQTPHELPSGTHPAA